MNLDDPCNAESSHESCICTKTQCLTKTSPLFLSDLSVIVGSCFYLLFEWFCHGIWHFFVCDFSQVWVTLRVFFLGKRDMESMESPSLGFSGSFQTLHSCATKTSNIPWMMSVGIPWGTRYQHQLIFWANRGLAHCQTDIQLGKLDETWWFSSMDHS